MYPSANHAVQLTRQYQQEAWREAENARLARQVPGERPTWIEQMVERALALAAQLRARPARRRRAQPSAVLQEARL